MILDFNIDFECYRKPMRVQVKIHDHVGALRSAAAKHTKVWQPPRAGRDPEKFDNILGICHRFHSENDPLVAIVRLAPPDLNIGIISHELVHAAVWMMQIETEWESNILEEHEHEEELCWIQGMLVHKTVEAMSEHGFQLRGENMVYNETISTP